MAEAVSAPQPQSTERVCISSFSDDGSEVRLRYKDNQIQIHLLAGVQIDEGIQKGDYVDAILNGSSLVALKNLPGYVPPVQTPKPANETQRSADVQKPAEQPTSTQQKSSPPQNQTGDSKPYNMKGILRKKQLDPGKDFYGFSLERIKEGKPTGDVKFYSLTSLENEKTLVESLHDLQEGHEIDYVQKNFQPVKIGPKGSLNSFGGGFRGKPYDPEADKRRQSLIVRQSCLDRATQLYIAKFGDKLKEIQGSHVPNILSIAEEFEDWVMRE